MRRILLVLSLLVPCVTGAQGEHDVVVTGGWMFTSTGNDRVRNPGLMIRGGKILRVGGDLAVAAPEAEVVRLADDETLIPGLIDLHAHYAVDFFGAGRVDEIVA